MQDLTEISHLKLPKIVEISLASNPVSRRRLYRTRTLAHLETLQIIDGLVVSAEDRDRVEAFKQEELFNNGVAHVVLDDIITPAVSSVNPNRSSLKVSTLSLAFDEFAK